MANLLHAENRGPVTRYEVLPRYGILIRTLTTVENAIPPFPSNLSQGFLIILSFSSQLFHTLMKTLKYIFTLIDGLRSFLFNRNSTRNHARSYHIMTSQPKHPQELPTCIPKTFRSRECPQNAPCYRGFGNQSTAKRSPANKYSAPPSQRASNTSPIQNRTNPPNGAKQVSI